MMDEMQSILVMLPLRMKISDHGGVAEMRNILWEDEASLPLQASCYLASLSLPCFVFSTYIYPSNLPSSSFRLHIN